MRKALVCGALLLLPLSAVALLYHRLETYTQVTHNESALVVQGYCILVFLGLFILWRMNRKKGRIVTALTLAGVLILAGVFYVGGRIPFCVECDQVTAEQLGFLTRWIPPCAGTGA